MSKIIFNFIIVSFIVFCPVFADKIILDMATFNDGTHEFYHELIKLALEKSGHEVIIKTPFDHIPQKRSIIMLETGDLTLLPLIQTEERNNKFIPIKVGLTNGLIGNRILLIPKDEQKNYDKVKNLQDFRNLNKIGGFGKDWYDITVWEANNLKYYIKDGEWRELYKIIADKKSDVHYFSRGFTEIVTEAEIHPELAIEKKLVLKYNRDFIFYLSPLKKEYKEPIENALKKARENQIIEKLIRKYWEKTFKEINYDNRIIINLTTP